MTCSNCQKEVEDGIENCPYCGKQVEPKAPVIKPKRTERFGLFKPIGKEPRGNDTDLPPNRNYHKPQKQLPSKPILLVLGFVFLICMILFLKQISGK